MVFEVQKIGILKRFAAFLLDIILLGTLAVAFAWLISLPCNYSHHVKVAADYHRTYDAYEEKYKDQLEKNYGVTFAKALDQLIASDYETLSAEDQAAYNEYKALPPVQDANNAYLKVYNLMTLMTSIGILLSYITLEFVVPLIFKNGQTIGKKLFSICLVRPDCVKISTMALFARTLLGKYAIETMVPVFIVYLILFAQIGWIGAFVLAALAILQLVLFFATKNRTPIHDLMGGTVVVDRATQTIFQTEDELIQTKNEAHAREVEQSRA